MTPRLPPWAAIPAGLLCGTAIGTITASLYLALALRTGFAGFDMLAVWRAGAEVRAAHPEAFKVAFGAVGLGAAGLGNTGFRLGLAGPERGVWIRPLADQGRVEAERHARDAGARVCLRQARAACIEGALHLGERHPACDDGRSDPGGEGRRLRDPEPSLLRRLHRGARRQRREFREDRAAPRDERRRGLPFQPL